MRRAWLRAGLALAASMAGRAVWAMASAQHPCLLTSAVSAQASAGDGASSSRAAVLDPAGVEGSAQVAIQVEEPVPIGAPRIPPGAAAPSSAGGATPDLDRAGILARDPRRLPRAAKDAWKGFDVAACSERAIVEPIALARDRVLRSDFVGALAPLLDLLEVRPDLPPALHMSGVLYYRLQRYGDSAALFARYVEVAPDRIGDTRMLGHDLYTLGRYEEAKAHYERVLEKAPNDVEAMRGLALSLWRMGDGKAALARLARALEIAPKNDELWSWKASIAFDLGDNVAAEEAAERALSLDAFEARTWFTLQRILEETGRGEAAGPVRARFESLGRTSAARRLAEARLALAPHSVTEFVAWLDATVAHGNPNQVRAALQRLSLTRELARGAPLWRAELDACRFLSDAERGGAAARELEACAGDDARAWRSLQAWYEHVRDEAGASRARSRLER